MSGYQVVTADMTRAAESLDALAEGLRTLDLVGPLHGVANALPGSESEPAARLLRDDWAVRVDAFVGVVQGIAGSMRDQGTDYDNRDGDAETRVQPSRLSTRLGPQQAV